MRALAAVITQETPQLVLCGRQAIDDDMGAVGAQLAEILGWPSVAWIMEETVDAEAKSVRVGRQVEGGLEVLDVPLPAVLSAQKGLNEPRYPTLKGIMAAKKKEIRAVAAPAASAARQKIVAIYVPEKSKKTRMVGGSSADAAAELVKLLRDEARVL